MNDRLSEERYMILKMLEEGKVSAEEATALLEALEESEAGSSGGTDDEALGASSGRRRYRHRRSEDAWGGFDREAFRETMEEVRRRAEKVRHGAIEIGDEVSRQVQEAMETWRQEWHRDGKRQVRHFVRNMGDVFHVPFGKETHEERFEHELEAEPGSLAWVRVKSLSGDVNFETWDNNTIRVEALKKVWARTQEEAEERSGDYQIYVETEGQELLVGARLAEEAPGWLPARCTIDYRVQLPAGLAVATDVTNGDVTVAGVRGGLDLKSTNGEIAARDLAGEVNIYSTNGDILASGVAADVLTVRSVNGDVELGLTGLQPGEHVVSTVHGDIQVTLPDDIQLDFRASTMHGRITCGFPGSVASRSATRLHARLGRQGETEADREAEGSNGGCELEARAVFGDVTVSSRDA